MKARVYSSIRTLMEVQGDIYTGIIPRGTRGTIIECYDSPVEGYAVDIFLPSEHSSTGYGYDSVVLYPEQFEVIARHV